MFLSTMFFTLVDLCSIFLACTRIACKRPGCPCISSYCSQVPQGLISRKQLSAKSSIRKPLELLFSHCDARPLRTSLPVSNRSICACAAQHQQCGWNNPLATVSATQQRNILPVGGFQRVHFSRPSTPTSPTHLVSCRYAGCLQDVSGTGYRMPVPERNSPDSCVRTVARNGCSHDCRPSNVMIYVSRMLRRCAQKVEDVHGLG